MNLCSEGHEEVCYEGRNCPACDLKEERDNFEKEVIELDNIIHDLKSEIHTLKRERDVGDKERP